MTTTELITDEARFATMGDEWNELLAASASDVPFLTWEWLYTWWKHLREDRTLHIVTVRDGERLIAIAPLALRPPRLGRLQPHRVLEFLGSGLVGSDYLDLIVRRGADRAALTALAAHFGDAGVVAELTRVRPQSSCASVMSGQLDEAGWTVVEEQTETCPYLDLAGHDWESYLQTLGSSHRYNVRRRVRNLEKSFTVEFEECTEPRRVACLDALVQLHHLRREQLGGSDALHTDELVAFHRELTEHALKCGWLRLYVMNLDGNPAASVYGFLYGGVYYFYQSGFDPGYNKFSVGLVVLAYSIRRAIEEGVAEYDLLHGNESYKYRWTSTQRPLVRLALYPPDRTGRWSLKLAGLKATLKSLRGSRDEAEDGSCRAA
ncbi:MAG: GNAT family N-acetyltransferase [Xanthomonadaceae bacterium]|nr:GNAT family N-acetyltransferase [Xanthomonadaceae bacterium]